jgi:uncharacterized membrane protein
MTTNVGSVDRIVRAIAGMAAVVAALAMDISGLGPVLLVVVGGILLVTAAMGFCPLYRVLGVSTCKVPQHQ